MGTSRVTATSTAAGIPPIETAKMTEGRKDSSMLMSRSLVVDVKGMGVRVELELLRSELIPVVGSQCEDLQA